MIRFGLSTVLFLQYLPYAEAANSICDEAAIIAAREEEVPVQLLQAITRVETGRQLDGKTQPWPWTLHSNGEGQWFQSRQMAEEYLMKERKNGNSFIDIGCFQLNHRWHGQNFPSAEAMLDPVGNARYAARYLKTLHSRGETDWMITAGKYHSRTPAYAQVYRSKVQKELARAPENGRTHPMISAHRSAKAKTGYSSRGTFISLETVRTPFFYADTQPLIGG